jgi:hypothetical protein
VGTRELTPLGAHGRMCSLGDAFLCRLPSLLHRQAQAASCVRSVDRFHRGKI